MNIQSLKKIALRHKYASLMVIVLFILIVYFVLTGFFGQNQDPYENNEIKTVDLIKTNYNGAYPSINYDFSVDGLTSPSELPFLERVYKPASKNLLPKAQSIIKDLNMKEISIKDDEEVYASNSSSLTIFKTLQYLELDYFYDYDSSTRFELNEVQAKDVADQQVRVLSLNSDIENSQVKYSYFISSPSEYFPSTSENYNLIQVNYFQTQNNIQISQTYPIAKVSVLIDSAGRAKKVFYVDTEYIRLDENYPLIPIESAMTKVNDGLGIIYFLDPRMSQTKIGNLNITSVKLAYIYDYKALAIPYYVFSAETEAGNIVEVYYPAIDGRFLSIRNG